MYNKKKGMAIMMVDKLNDVLNHVETYTTMYVFCSYTKSHIHDIADMTIEEVAKACQDKPSFFSKECDLPQNTKMFAQSMSKTITYVGEKINYSHLNRLINDILRSKKVYLYAQGDNRSLCNVIQVELSTLYIPVVICDADFIKSYQFKEEHLLIILSTNGTIFQLNKRIISRLVHAEVNTWLITCNCDIEFSKNKLIVPSCKAKYNKYAIRHVIDIVIAAMRFVQQL